MSTMSGLGWVQRNDSALCVSHLCISLAAGKKLWSDLVFDILLERGFEHSVLQQTGSEGSAAVLAEVCCELTSVSDGEFRWRSTSQSGLDEIKGFDSLLLHLSGGHIPSKTESSGFENQPDLPKDGQLVPAAVSLSGWPWRGSATRVWAVICFYGAQAEAWKTINFIRHVVI